MDKDIELRLVASANYEAAARLALLIMRNRDAYPQVDTYSAIQRAIKEQTGKEFPRSAVKIAVFGIIYDITITKLAYKLQISETTADEVRAAVLGVLDKLSDSIKVGTACVVCGADQTDNKSACLNARCPGLGGN